MVKIIFCLRRRPELSIEEFHRYWRDVHAPLVKSVAETLRIRHYAQSYTFCDDRTEKTITARSMDLISFDGVAELWWDSMDDVLAAGDTKEGRDAGRRLAADERNFIDLPNSVMFYATENKII